MKWKGIKINRFKVGFGYYNLYIIYIERKISFKFKIEKKEDIFF